MEYRTAHLDDLDLLAEWNHQLIQDEAHRNPMTVSQLRDRMQEWISTDYSAIIFNQNGEPVAYALFREKESEIYLRQLFVKRGSRNQGIGREAIRLLRDDIWPRSKRLTVDVLSHNTRGIAFWHSVGFRDYCLTMEVMPSADCQKQMT